MDGPLVRLAQASGIKTSGAHEWPSQVDEDISEFISSVEPRAIFVVEQDEGLIIGPPPRSSSDHRVLVIAKPKGTLPIDDWDQHVVSAALPLSDGAVYRQLHSLIAQAIIPIFDSQRGNASAQARHRLVEAERALAQLLQHTQVAFIDLCSGTAVSRVQKLLERIRIHSNDENADVSAADLNELQSIVNTWKQQVTQLASSDRDVREGSVSDEVSFWITLEAALISVQEQLSGSFVSSIFRILESNKRFHAIHNFGGETGLNDALTKVQGYTQLLFRDLPVGEMLAASSFEQLVTAVETIFLHINRKLRASGYPAQRSIALVEIIGREFCTILLKIAESKMETVSEIVSTNPDDLLSIISIVRELKMSVMDAADVWDTQVREFASIARDLMRRRSERFIVVKIDTPHVQLVSRISALDALCTEQADLAPLVKAASIDGSSLDKAFREILETRGLLQLSDEERHSLEVTHAKEVHSAEKKLAESILAELLQAQSDQADLYDVFERHKSIMRRPEVRVVAHKFQTSLIKTIKEDIRVAERRSKQLPNPHTHIVERVMRMQQLKLRAEEIKHRLSVVFGPDWVDHAEGAQIGVACDSLESNLDIKSEVEEWSKRFESLYELKATAGDGEKSTVANSPVFSIRHDNKLIVHGTNSANQASLRALKALGFRFDSAVSSTVEKLAEQHAAYTRLVDCLASLTSIIATMNIYPRIKSSNDVMRHSNQVMAFVRLGLTEMTWESTELSEFVYGFEHAISLLEIKTTNIAKIDCLIAEELSAPGNDLENTKEVIHQLLSKVSSHEYQIAVMRDLSLIIGKKLDERLQKWKPSCRAHKVELNNRSVQISPDLSSTLTEWFNELNYVSKLAEGTDADLVSSYSLAEQKIWQHWDIALAQAKHWLDLQPMWGLNISEVISKYSHNTEILVGILQELQNVRNNHFKDEPAVTLDVSEIKPTFESKFDAWQDALVSAIARLVQEQSTRFLNTSREARKHIEISKLDLDGLLSVMKLAAKGQDVFSEITDKIPILMTANSLLTDMRYDFNVNWVSIDLLKDEHSALGSILEKCAKDLEKNRSRLLEELESRTAFLVKDVEYMRQKLMANKPLQPHIDPDQAVKTLNQFEVEVREILDKLNSITEATVHLDSERPMPLKLKSLLSETNSWLSEIETLTLGWLDIKSGWQRIRQIGNTPWFSVDSIALGRDLRELQDQIEGYPTRTQQLRSYKKLMEYVALNIDGHKKVKLLRESDAIQYKHLAQLVPSISTLSKDTLHLGEILTKLPESDKIMQIVELAEGEYQLQRYLDTVKKKWLITNLDGHDGAFYNLDAILQLAKDHLTAFTAMRASPYFSAIAASVQDWERRIGNLRQVFDTLVDVQRQYMYLRGILTSDAVATILPNESRRFKSVAEEFLQVYIKAEGRPALEIAGIPRLQQNLSRLDNQFASLHKSLCGYLETQRQRFSRLCFVGDEDLLEIVGSSIDVWGFKYLSAIFPGVSELRTDHFVSSEGEKLPFSRSFELDNKFVDNLELLVQLESLINDSVRASVRIAIEQLKQAWPDPHKFAEWLVSTTVQSAIIALREQWSRFIIEIENGSMQFSQCEKDYDSILQLLANSGDDSLLWTRRRESLIAEVTHERNFLQAEHSDLLITVEESSGNSVVIRCGSHTWPYGYEYLGAQEPIVQTLATDDLFLSAASAIGQGKGGCIIGPAGTGKTETIKALGALFGRRVVVFNCDNQFDFLTMCRVMNGCTSTNSWVCFDEFNRLSRGVLSSVAQVVSESVKKAPVFVTMNPGYLGRTILPPNMREQFREFVLEHPDTKEIARVLLCAHGKVIPEVADATVELLEKMSQKSSKQRHYDWGLRALKGILRVYRLIHGNMRRACEIAVRPRLIPEDQYIFDESIDALFKFEEYKEHLAEQNDYHIQDELKPYVENLGIFTQLFPGVMLLGPSGCGKSKVWKTLAKSKNSETVVVDPSAVSKSALIGHLDHITREWKDGVLVRVLRKVLNNLRGEQKKQWYIIFDGEIEPDWAEALNSVLDENRKITLASGEILPLPRQVHLIFETTNLDSATPATVSRCGMICMPPSRLDAEEQKAIIPRELLEVAANIEHSMEFTESRIQMVYSTLDIGNPLLTMAWALAGDSNSSGRLAISDAIRSISDQENLPQKGSLTDYYISDLSGRWHSWESSIGNIKDLGTEAISRPDVVVPTADTMSHESILQAALRARLPLILVGPPGSGKTMTLFNALRQIDQVSLIPLNFSSTATPELVIRALEMHCELSTSNDGTKILSPPGSKWAVLFIDEINLPSPKNASVSSAIPVIQFLRYLIEYNGFLDSSGEFIKVERVQLVGACNPPPQRRPLPSAFLRHFMVVRVEYPSIISLRRIYKSFLSTFGAESVLDSMLNVYENLPKVLPKETWTPRELTRWMRGIYTDWMSASEIQHDNHLLAELWLYEAQRVLSDRLESNDKLLVSNLLCEFYPLGSTHAPIENLRLMVWTNFVSQRPRFINIDEFRVFLEARLPIFVDEASGEADSTLTVHTEFAQHVSRIDRVLRHPQGHALLVGPPSVGKTTAVRFASWLVGLDLNIFRSHSRYTDQEFAQDLRRTLLSAVRRPVCILLGDDLLRVPEFVERMNSLLANGEVPGLFETQEQISELEEHCTRAGFSGGDIVPWFRSRIVSNLHVVFTTTDITNASPALLNRCAVNRVEPWSLAVKRQIAQHWCSETDVDSGVVAALASLPPEFPSKDIPNRDEMIFLETCRQFVRIYNSKKLELEDSQRHLVSGSDRLKSTVLEIGQLKRRLAEQQVNLSHENKRSSEVLSQMLREQSEAERKRVAAVEIRIALQAQTQEIENRQSHARNDLAATEPLIRQAAEGVQNIKKSQLNELRSLMNPPEPVKITLEAVCLVLGLRTDGSWRQVLAAVRGDEFIPRIVNFDSNRLTPSLISQIEREYMSYSDFTYERVDRASKACGPLLRWVVAQVAYGRATAAVKPLLDEIKKLNDQSAESRAQLDAIESMLTDLETAIERSKKEYSNTVAHCEKIKAEMQTVTSQLARAESLLASLSDEKERWANVSSDFPRNVSLLPGKALVEACLISISGMLDPKEKQTLMEYIKDVFKENSISLDDNLTSLPLALDSTQNIIDHSWSVVLVVDPANRWNPQDFLGSNMGITSFLLDPDTLKKEIDAALRFGQSLVVQHAERFDPLILPLLTRNFARKGSRLFVNLGNGDIDVSPGFKLILHARDLESVSQCSPLLLNLVSIIDYGITVNKFEHMVQDALLLSQMPDLAKRRLELLDFDNKTTKKLRNLEKQLLTALAETSATEKLLENQTLIHSLEKLKEETIQLKSIKASTIQTLGEFDEALLKYLPQAQTAASIYEDVKKLPTIDKFYIMGVEWLWDIVQKLSSDASFDTKFLKEVKSRVMAITKSEHWNKIPMLSIDGDFLENGNLINLTQLVEECPPNVPIIAGMATTNTNDPATLLHNTSETSNMSIVAMGSSQSIVRADRLLVQAMEYGEWLIIQNVEIANLHWLQNLTRRLQNDKLSPNFRLILTGLQSEVSTIPDLLTVGRPVSVERQHGVKLEILESLTPKSDNTDFLICWIHACFATKFTTLSFSAADLDAARWLVSRTSKKSLKQALLTVVWTAKTGSLAQRSAMHEFVMKAFDYQGLPQSQFDEWVTKLPDDNDWLPKELSYTEVN